MNGDPRGRQVMARIGFAERWLHRAKRHCGDGDVTRGLLTLVLAKAEMHYALETGGMSLKAGSRQRMTPALLGVVALSVAVVVAASWLEPPAPPAHSAAATVPIVRLVTPVGTWLDFVQAPVLSTSPLPALVSGAQAVGPRLVVRHGSSALRPSPDQAAPGQALVDADAASVPVTATAVVGPAPSAPPVLLSAVDLIDLTLAADRTLRRAPANP